MGRRLRPDLWRRAATAVLLLTPMVGAAPVGASHQPVPIPDVLLYANPAWIVLSTDGQMCARQMEGLPNHPVAYKGVVTGQLEMLGYYESLPDERIVLKDGGHTIVLQSGSDVAIIDGRRVRLERKVDTEFGVRAPLTKMGAVLGYRFITGAFEDPDKPGGIRTHWIIRLPKDAPMPPAIEAAWRVVTSGRSWVLIHTTTHSRSEPVCGRPSGLSGSLVNSRDGPWADGRALAREVPWRMTWDGRHGNGRVTFRERTVALALRTTRGTLTLLIGGRAYVVPKSLVATMRSGLLAIPIVRVAAALRWDHWQPVDIHPILVLSPP